MEKRIIKLETEQEMIKAELTSYSKALEENTKSLQKLTEILIRHDEQLRQEQDDTATRNAIITGVVVGVVVFIVTGIVQLL